MTKDMGVQSLKAKAVKGALWTLLERFTTQLAGFFVTLVLARLLTPDDYGTVALLSVLVTVSGIFVDCSFGQALVQKKDAGDIDFNSVFYFSVIFSVVVYCMLFFAAPLVARFYGKPELVALLRVLSLTIILSAINGVQGAELSKKLLFNLSFRISLTRFVMTSVTGVSLALLKYGPWALVWSSVAGSVGSVCASWYFIAWRPRLMFSFTVLKGLFSYGWKISFSWFLSSAFDNIYGMVIGKLYSPADLAFLDKGRQLPSLAMSSINGVLHRVSFPTIALIQDDREHVRAVMRRMIQCSTFLVFPMLTGLAVSASKVVPIFFGGQWLDSIPFVWLFCFGFMLYPFHTINLQTLSAIGRSDVFLKLEIIKKFLSVAILVASYRFGPLWMVAVGAFIGGPIGVLINAYPNRKLLGYSVAMQVRDTLPSFYASAAMACVILPFNMLNVNMIAVLILQVIIGSIAFFFISWIFRIQPLCEYSAIIDKILAGRMPQFLYPLYQSYKGRLGI